MNSNHDDLYEALADAAGSGCSLGPEWTERLRQDGELRAIVQRFEQTTKLMTDLPALSAPSNLEGRVVGTLQAGHREDRVAEALRGLTPQTAPPELEALVAESLPGEVQRSVPKELDERIEALLRDWEVTETREAVVSKPRMVFRRVLPLGLATAASLLFVVVLAAPWESEHEAAREAYVRSVEILPAGSSIEGTPSFGAELLNGATGGLSEFASRARTNQATTTTTTTMQALRRAPARTGRRVVVPSARGGAGAQSGSQNSNAGGTGAASRSGADILTKLAAPHMPPHRGVRTVRLSAGPDSPIVLIYREDVSVAADGTFAVDPIEIVQPPMSPASADLFLLMQKARESFFHRFRDFHIRDLALFIQQYATFQRFNSAIVSGMECFELDIERIDGEGYRYILWVEPVSGLCLRIQEYDEDGLFVGEVEYESIEFNPNFLAPLSGGPSTWLPIAAGAGATEVLFPLWIPQGYVLVATEVRTDAAGDEWVRLSYTDGVETLFVLQSTSSTNGTAPLRGPAADALTRVAVQEVGAWTAVEGETGELRLIVLGKRAEADLVAVLASTIP